MLGYYMNIYISNLLNKKLQNDNMAKIFFYVASPVTRVSDVEISKIRDIATGKRVSVLFDLPSNKEVNELLMQMNGKSEGGTMEQLRTLVTANAIPGIIPATLAGDLKAISSIAGVNLKAIGPDLNSCDKNYSALSYAFEYVSLDMFSTSYFFLFMLSLDADQLKQMSEMMSQGKKDEGGIEDEEEARKGYASSALSKILAYEYLSGALVSMQNRYVYENLNREIKKSDAVVIYLELLAFADLKQNLDAHGIDYKIVNEGGSQYAKLSDLFGDIQLSLMKNYREKIYKPVISVKKIDQDALAKLSDTIMYSMQGSLDLAPDLLSKAIAWFAVVAATSLVPVQELLQGDPGATIKGVLGSSAPKISSAEALGVLMQAMQSIDKQYVNKAFGAFMKAGGNLNVFYSSNDTFLLWRKELSKNIFLPMQKFVK